MVSFCYYTAKSPPPFISALYSHKHSSFYAQNKPNSFQKQTHIQQCLNTSLKTKILQFTGLRDTSCFTTLATIEKTVLTGKESHSTSLPAPHRRDLTLQVLGTFNVFHGALQPGYEMHKIWCAAIFPCCYFDSFVYFQYFNHYLTVRQYFSSLSY